MARPHRARARTCRGKLGERETGCIRCTSRRHGTACAWFVDARRPRRARLVHCDRRRVPLALELPREPLVCLDLRNHLLGIRTRRTRRRAQKRMQRGLAVDAPLFRRRRHRGLCEPPPWHRCVGAEGAASQLTQLGQRTLVTFVLDVSAPMGRAVGQDARSRLDETIAFVALRVMDMVRRAQRAFGS